GRAVDDGAVQRVQRGYRGVPEDHGVAYGPLDLVTQLDEPLGVLALHAHAGLSAVEVGVEGATEGHVDRQVAEVGCGDPQVTVQQERRHVEEPHPTDT